MCDCCEECRTDERGVDRVYVPTMACYRIEHAPGKRARRVVSLHGARLGNSKTFKPGDALDHVRGDMTARYMDPNAFRDMGARAGYGPCSTCIVYRKGDDTE